MACELVWEPDGVVKRFSGVVSAREFVKGVERVQSDPRYDEAHYVINDFSNVVSHELDESVLHEVAILQYGAHASHPNCRIVFVTQDEGLSALLELSAASASIESYQTAVLPSVTAARDWLDSQPQLQLMSNVMGFQIG